MTYIDRNLNTGNKLDLNFLFLTYTLIALKSLGALCSLGVGLKTGADVLILYQNHAANDHDCVTSI